MPRRLLHMHWFAPDWITSTVYITEYSNPKITTQIRHAAARIVMKRGGNLIDLHWLPLQFRITFKLLLTCKSLNRTQLLKPKIRSHHNLRSNAILNNLEIRDSKLCCGDDRDFNSNVKRME